MAHHIPTTTNKDQTTQQQNQQLKYPANTTQNFMFTTSITCYKHNSVRVTLSSNIFQLTANGSELLVTVNALTVFNSLKIRLQPDDSDSSWQE